MYTGWKSGIPVYVCLGDLANKACDGCDCSAVVALERFSIECRRTKTKVITLANHKERRQYSEPIKTQSN